MTNLQNVSRGLRVLGSYSDYVDFRCGFIYAGPKHKTDIETEIMHENEANILKSNNWFFDDTEGYWTIE